MDSGGFELTCAAGKFYRNRDKTKRREAGPCGQSHEEPAVKSTETGTSKKQETAAVKTRNRIMRFASVGAAAFILDMGLYNALLVAEVGATRAKLLAGLLATIASWAASRHWTFTDRAKTNPVRQLAGYIGAGAIGLAITAGIVWIGTTLISGNDSIITANLWAGVGIAAATLWRWAAYNHILFKPHAKTAEQPLTEPASSA